MPVQCPECKSVNRDSALFCEKCGIQFIPSASEKKPPNASLKPDTLPEFDTGPSSPQPLKTKSSQLQTPKIRTGATFGNWFAFVFIVLIFSFISFVVFVETHIFDRGTPPQFIITCVVIFLICFPVFMKISWKKGYLGFVTHLRKWDASMAPQNPKSKIKHIPNWVFHLQQTDDRWRPLKDARGFLQPVIEIAYRADKLHGLPLEEGCAVAIRGRKKSGGKFKVHTIWNLGAPCDAAGDSQGGVFWGRITNWTQPGHTPDMRFPGENRNLEIWSFRLQQTDSAFNSLLRDGNGNLLDPVPVEIKATSITGPINNGDKVEMHGRLANNSLRVRQMINHSAGRASIKIREPLN